MRQRDNRRLRDRMCPDMRPDLPGLYRKLGKSGRRIRKLGKSGHLEPKIDLQNNRSAQFAQRRSRSAQLTPEPGRKLGALESFFLQTGPNGTESSRTGQNGISTREPSGLDSRVWGNRSVTGSGYPVTWSESRHAERARPVTGLENRCGTRPSGLRHRERSRRVTFRPHRVTQVAPRDDLFAPCDAHPHHVTPDL